MSDKREVSRHGHHLQPAAQLLIKDFVSSQCINGGEMLTRHAAAWPFCFRNIASSHGRSIFVTDTDVSSKCIKGNAGKLPARYHGALI